MREREREREREFISLQFANPILDSYFFIIKKIREITLYLLVVYLKNTLPTCCLKIGTLPALGKLRLSLITYLC